MKEQMQRDGGNLERVLIQGDLSGLTEEERMAFYDNVCRSSATGSPSSVRPIGTVRKRF